MNEKRRSGLATSPSWTAESDQVGAQFGFSVAAAGDINGDGYSDIIVGANLYDNGQTDEGQAYLYYGNSGRGTSLIPRQRRTSDTAPIAHLGASDSTSAFRLALLGLTPFRAWTGEAPVGGEATWPALQWGGGTQTSTTSADTGVSGTTLSETVSGLSRGTPYHWRMRLRYASASTPFAQASRWLTMPWKGWQETMLRTISPPGRVPETTGGPPLLVTKSGGADITLTWALRASHRRTMTMRSTRRRSELTTVILLDSARRAGR